MVNQSMFGYAFVSTNESTHCADISIQQFGMHVTPDPLSIRARILPPPTLKYGVGSRQPTIVGFGSELCGFLLNA